MTRKKPSDGSFTTFLFLLLFLVLTLLRLRPFIVLSGSMAPAIKTGSLVLVDTCGRDPEKGEIITFSNGSSYVTHRILEKKKDGNLITKGDANSTIDPAEVPKSQLLGTVKIIIPWIGYPIQFCHQHPLICLLFILFFYTIQKWNRSHALFVKGDFP